MECQGLGTLRRNKIRVIYFSGPGDIVGTFRFWDRGLNDPRQQSITYSGQVYNVCKKVGCQLIAISRDVKKDSHLQGQIEAINRYTWWINQKGIRLQIGYFLRGLYIFYACVKYRPKIIFVADGNTFWFMLLPLKLMGIKISPVLHCTFWPQKLPVSMYQRILIFMARPLFRSFAHAILSVSSDITEQITHIRDIKPDSAKTLSPILEFLPSYHAAAADFQSPCIGNGPFNILFASRIEANKGIYELISIAQKLKAQQLDIQLHVAGDGADSVKFNVIVHELGLVDIIKIYGYCDKSRMAILIESSHAFLVPTTSQFVEGFNKVCLEGVLAGRPIIASSACPAINYLGAAAVIVEPNDTDGYFDAIMQLYSDDELYRRKVDAALEYRKIFLRDSWSFESAVEEVVNSLMPEKSEITNRTVSISR